jgi:hypothetical protein
MLSRVLVIIDGVRLVIGFIDHSQVVTTTKYNTLVDSHITNHSTLNLLGVLSVVFTVRFLSTDLSQSSLQLQISLQLQHMYGLQLTLSLLGTV